MRDKYWKFESSIDLPKRVYVSEKYVHEKVDKRTNCNNNNNKRFEIFCWSMNKRTTGAGLAVCQERGVRPQCSWLVPRDTVILLLLHSDNFPAVINFYYKKTTERRNEESNKSLRYEFLNNTWRKKEGKKETEEGVGKRKSRSNETDTYGISIDSQTNIGESSDRMPSDSLTPYFSNASSTKKNSRPYNGIQTKNHYLIILDRYENVVHISRRHRHHHHLRHEVGAREVIIIKHLVTHSI